MVLYSSIIGKYLCLRIFELKCTVEVSGQAACLFCNVKKWIEMEKYVSYISFMDIFILYVYNIFISVPYMYMR